jgi:hypothetical protein
VEDESPSESLAEKISNWYTNFMNILGKDRNSRASLYLTPQQKPILNMADEHNESRLELGLSVMTLLPMRRMSCVGNVNNAFFRKLTRNAPEYAMNLPAGVRREKRQGPPWLQGLGVCFREYGRD